MALVVVILAAGKGSRMRSAVPKVLHQLAGKSLLNHLLDTVRVLNPQKVVVVYNQEIVRETVDDASIVWAKQVERQGTGDAVKCACQVLGNLQAQDQILILCGDVPLIQSTTLSQLLSLPSKIKILAAQLDNPFGYGRLIFNPHGDFLKIVEEQEASEQEKKVRTVNSGIIAIEYQWLVQTLPRLTRHRNGEYYLTDLMALAVQESIKVLVHFAQNPFEVQGINNLLQLSQAERWYQKNLAEQLMLKGLQIKDPARFDLRGQVCFGEDVVIEPNVLLDGKIQLGNGTVIETGCCLKNVTLGNNVRVRAYSVLEEAVIEDEAIVGPFARLRAGSHLAKNSRVGNFVELKQCKLGEQSKVNHLTYLGDAEVGQRVNIGAGTITCNYDGKLKSKTKIGDNAFIGSNVALVAPVVVEQKAIVGAGSVITRLVPADNLALGRGKQVNLKKKNGQ